MSNLVRAAGRIPVRSLRAYIAELFVAEGFSFGAADRVADSLVEADARGIASHGAMLVPLYLERLARGSVSRYESPETVAERPAFVSLDARHCLGQLSSDPAAEIAAERAGRFGIAIVTVRHAFHFGAAFRYAEAIARAGMIGMALSNTRPLMPAVGGAEAVVGNNPLAVSVPGEAGPVFTLDMALSEAAMGKIRLAGAEGEPIPLTWATDADGVPTSDPAAAINGLLLPTGGAKGFGLALVVDALTGVLSGGAFGGDVQGLYADATRPYDTAHTFIAIDPAVTTDFAERAEALARSVSGSRRRPEVDRLYLPGEIQADLGRSSAANGVELAASTLDALIRAGEERGVDVAPVCADQESASQQSTSQQSTSQEGK